MDMNNKSEQEHTILAHEGNTSNSHISKQSKVATIIEILKNSKFLFAVGIIYFILSLIIFYPISSNITTVVSGSGGDPYQMLWNNWWVGYSTFTLHQSIYFTHMLFSPIGANLVYQTFIPIGSLIIYPFEAISHAFAYNVLLFIGLTLSAMTMYILANYLVKNKYAAFIAGIVFTFSSFHIAQSYGHIEYANIEWIPLFVYLFLRLIKEDYFKINHKHVKYGSYLVALLLSITFLLAMFMGDVEQGIMLSMLIVLILIFYLVQKRSRPLILNKNFIKLFVIFIIATLILGSWAFIPFATHFSSSTVNQLNDITHNMIWSDDLLSFFVPTVYNGIFSSMTTSYLGIYHGDISETSSYIGYSVILLSLYAIYTKRKDLKEVYLWVFLGIIFFLLSLGPYIQINTSNTGIPSLYLLFKQLPLLSVLREPGRFDLIFTMVVAVLSAMGADQLMHALKKRNIHVRLKKLEIILAAIITLIIILEVATPPLSSSVISQLTTSVSIPSLYYQIGNLSQNFTMLVLPILPNPYSFEPALYPGEATFSTAITHKSIIGGYITRENNTQSYSVLNIPLAVGATSLEYSNGFDYYSPIYQNYTNQTLLSLYFYNATIVVLNERAYNTSSLGDLLPYLTRTFGSPIYNYNSTIAFSTTNAIDTSIFHNYVGFPTLSDWNGSVYNINNKPTILWVPYNSGAISVYAPQSNQSQYINTSISINAISLGSLSRVEVLQYDQANGATVPIGLFNVSNKISQEVINTKLLEGSYGNRLYFAYSNNTYPVGIINITFTKRS